MKNLTDLKSVTSLYDPKLYNKSLIIPITVFLTSFKNESKKEMRTYLFDNYLYDLIKLIDELFPNNINKDRLIDLIEQTIYIEITYTEENGYRLNFYLDSIADFLMRAFAGWSIDDAVCIDSKDSDLFADRDNLSVKELFLLHLDTYKYYIRTIQKNLKLEEVDGKLTLKNKQQIDLDNGFLDFLIQLMHEQFNYYANTFSDIAKEPNLFYSYVYKNIKYIKEEYPHIEEVFSKPLDIKYIDDNINLELFTVLSGLRFYYLIEKGEENPLIVNVVSAATEIIRSSDDKEIIDHQVIMLSNGKSEYNINSNKMVRKFDKFIEDHKEYEEFLFEPIPKKEKEVIEKVNMLELIPSLEDFYIPEIVTNLKGQKLITTDSLLKYSKNISELERLIRNNSIWDVLKSTYFPFDIDSSLVLEASLNKDANVKITLSYEELIKLLIKEITGDEVDLSECKTQNDVKEVFINTLMDYGDLINDVLDYDEYSEKIETNFAELNKKLKDEGRLILNHEEYLNKTTDLILTLSDSIDDLMKICENDIGIKNIESNLKIEEYFLSEAYNKFISFKENIENDGKIKKEEYLVLAKYINALRQVVNSQNYQVKIDEISAKDLLKQYEALVENNADYDLETSPFYSLFNDKDKIRKIIANWRILPSGTINKLGKKKLKKEKNSNLNNESFSSKYEKVIKRKRFLDSTDATIMSGINELLGYVGYYYPNGLVIFEKFFKDIDEVQPDPSNATYLMNLNNFIQMSTLTKPEVIEYIKDGNTDVKRVNHNETWEHRVKQAIKGKMYTNVIKEFIESEVKNTDEIKLVSEGKK